MLVAVTGSVCMAVTPLLAGYGLELWLFSVKVLLASSSQTIFFNSDQMAEYLLARPSPALFAVRFPDCP